MKEGVPKGKVVDGVWTSDKVYPGTERKYFVYTPAQYDGKTPAALMVFQDGGSYVNANGAVPRADRVRQSDPGEGNAGHDRHLSQSGRVPASRQRRQAAQQSQLRIRFARRSIRRFSARRNPARVWQKHDLKLTDDPDSGPICGISSGGICAWTVAWERPDAFRKVLSHVGSFTNIRGGHVYPALIRKTERKPIRVFLQDGSDDLDNLHGNWPLANQEMAAALKFMEYDYHFEMGDGAHTGKHGGAILPESLRWLWREASK